MQNRIHHFCALLAFSIVASMSWIAAHAHHSIQWLLDENGERVIEVIEGTVRAFRILNPHGALIITALNAAGEDENWLIELNPATQLLREGWAADMLQPGDTVTVAINRVATPNRGPLRALIVHGAGTGGADELYVAYGIRGDSPIMRRLQQRLPACGKVDRSYMRSECFLLDEASTQTLEQEFPGKMGYVFP